MKYSIRLYVDGVYVGVIWCDEFVADGKDLYLYNNGRMIMILHKKDKLEVEIDEH